jgi:hypothetical protein
MKTVALEAKIFSVVVKHVIQKAAPFYLGREKGSERGHCYSWEFNSLPALLPKSACHAIRKHE